MKDRLLALVLTLLYVGLFLPWPLYVDSPPFWRNVLLFLTGVLILGAVVKTLRAFPGTRRKL